MKRTFYDFKKADKQLKAELTQFEADLGVGETLAQYLLRLMREKDLTAPQVYRRAELDRQTYNKLIQLNRPARAAKKTLLRVCIGIRASEEEAEKILSACGYTFELSLNADKAFLFCLRGGYHAMQAVHEVKYILDQEVKSDRDIGA